MKRALVIGAVLVVLFLLANKATAAPSSTPAIDPDEPTPPPMPSGPQPVPATSAQVQQGFADGIARVLNSFGPDIAAQTEQLIRHETANLTSRNFLLTFTPGMHAFSSSFPWGWTSIPAAGLSAQDFNPLVTMQANVIPGTTTDTLNKWVAFKRLPDAVAFMGYYIKKYGVARWNGGQDPNYVAKVTSFPTPTLSSLA